MKKMLSLIFCLIVFCLPLTSALAVDFEKAEATLSFDKTEVYAGDTVTLYFGFNNASEYPFGLSAFTSNLTFDKTAFEVENIKYNVPKTSITENATDGKITSLYIFLSIDKEAGFNKNDTFYEVTFKVNETALGNYQFAVDFDEVNVVVYGEANKAEAYAVGANSPKAQLRVLQREQSSEIKPPASSQQSTQSVILFAQGSLPSYEGQSVASSQITESQSASSFESQASSRTEQVKRPNRVTVEKPNLLPVVIIFAVILIAVSVTVIFIILRRRK